MEQETYQGTVAKDLSSFSFTSVGPNGRIEKSIYFKPTAIDPQLYNLALVDTYEDGAIIDDFAISDNGDRDKILATVIRAVVLYTRRYPDRWVQLIGNTAARTRLYRIVISTNLLALDELFVIYGVLADFQLELFAPGHSYIGFLVTKK
jgi:hypothetical protein